MSEEGIIVPVQIKREFCRDNIGSFEASPRPGMFIEGECFGCGLYYICEHIDGLEERLDALEHYVERGNLNED